MGLLVDGQWTTAWYDTKKTGGKFVRSQAQFRNWVTPDGRPGPTGEGGFAAERDRYHLYVAWACPWAHRTLLYRSLRKLEDLVSVSIVDWFMGDEGWTFSERPGAVPDHVNGKQRLYEIYTKADPNYSGRVTVPILWDKKRETIVSNESADIIRMFNSAFDDVGAHGPNFLPEAMRAEIDTLNERIYETVNDGVYKSGFATTQAAYENAVTALFETLEFLEERLATRRFLMGDEITEADLRLFPTLVRFDFVYHYHFKCNLQRLRDFPNLWNYTLDVYQTPGVAETLNLEHVKKHYYGSHESINPHRVVPLGPNIDLWARHGREQLAAAE